MWPKLKILMLLFLLASCGFEPLYVERSSDKKWYYNGEFKRSIADEMAQIKVEPAADRIGQLIRNELLDSLTPKGVPQSPKYRFVITNIERSVSEQAMRDDITASRERVYYKAEYEMYDAKTGNRLIKGDAIAYLGYDIMANPYSTTFSQKKLEQDAAKIMSGDIALRVGAYFHSVLTKRGNPNEL